MVRFEWNQIEPDMRVRGLLVGWHFWVWLLEYLLYHLKWFNKIFMVSMYIDWLYWYFGYTIHILSLILVTQYFKQYILLKATFSVHKITTHKKLKCLPYMYILISHFTGLSQWFIILGINNLVKVSQRYWMLLKLSIKWNQHE